ncbi:MAG: hypothetical protein AB1391_00820 [Candidatus Micrarchaeota archaeon]
MKQQDVLYLIFWSLIIAFVLFFAGFGNKAAFLFCFSLVGIVFVERLESITYASGAIFLALAFTIYLGKTLSFIGQLFMASLIFLLLPFILFGVRKRIRATKEIR